jgi:hypothetical protein
MRTRLAPESHPLCVSVTCVCTCSSSRGLMHVKRSTRALTARRKHTPAATAAHPSRQKQQLASAGALRRPPPSHWGRRGGQRGGPGGARRPTGRTTAFLRGCVARALVARLFGVWRGCACVGVRACVRAWALVLRCVLGALALLRQHHPGPQSAPVGHTRPPHLTLRCSHLRAALLSCQQHHNKLGVIHLCVFGAIGASEQRSAAQPRSHPSPRPTLLLPQ